MSSLCKDCTCNGKQTALIYMMCQILKLVLGGWSCSLDGILFHYINKCQSKKRCQHKESVYSCPPHECCPKPWMPELDHLQSPKCCSLVHGISFTSSSKGPNTFIKIYTREILPLSAAQTRAVHPYVHIILQVFN